MVYLDDVSREGVRRILRTSVLDVTFTKVDGTERVMKCTLNEDLIPQTTRSETPRKSNPDVCAVWDLENQSWRSFRWDSIQTVGV